jgi:hypothetical protein
MVFGRLLPASLKLRFRSFWRFWWFEFREAGFQLDDSVDVLDADLGQFGEALAQVLEFGAGSDEPEVLWPRGSAAWAGWVRGEWRVVEGVDHGLSAVMVM